MRLAIKSEKSRHSVKTGFFLEIDSTVGAPITCSWTWKIKNSNSGKIFDHDSYENVEFTIGSETNKPNGFWFDQMFDEKQKFECELTIKKLKTSSDL